MIGSSGVALVFLLVCVGGGWSASSWSSSWNSPHSSRDWVGGAPLCHPNCDCLDTYFDCRRRGLQAFPLDLPNWVQKLNLSVNEIGGVEGAALARLPHLTLLSLDGNNLTEIPNSPVQLNALSVLSLGRNGVTEIDGGALGSYVALRELDLSRNRIHLVHNNSFPVNSSIRILNLGGNRIERLEPGCFERLVHLEELILTRNRISSISKTLFINNLNLHKLDLSRNKLEQMDSLRFQELKKLSVLNLRRNGMRNLSDAAFYGLDKLQTLYLDGNVISVVEKRWLYGLCSLRTLNLSTNAVSEIESDCWEYMEELQTLDLSENALKGITRGSVKGLKRLRHFHLSHNQIESIEEEAFLPMEKLESLDLSWNGLWWALEDTEAPFEGLGNCVTLNLAHNQLESLHYSILQGLTSLQVLSLGSNPLKWLDGRAFEGRGALALRLDNVTSLVCDCHLKWLHSKLGVTGSAPTGATSGKGRGRHRGEVAPVEGNETLPSCAFPPEVQGSPLTQVNSDKLACPASGGWLPRFVVDPKTETLLMDGAGLLSCAAQSQSPHSFNLTWTKNRLPLPPHLSSGVETLERILPSGWVEVSSQVKLGNVGWVDAGSYQCVAHSSFGRVYSPQANLTVHIFPSFVKKPSNVTVRLGSDAKLECGAKGHPAPEIAFQKEGGEDFPAALQRRFHVLPNEDSFIIMQVKLIDMGTYCCSATNAAGEIRSCASVTVFQTPRLVSGMVDSRVVEGSNTILECVASGSPPPQINWSKDAVLLRPGHAAPRLTFKENSSLLIIKAVEFKDAGRYECLLSNAVGTARHALTLTVIPLGSGGLVHWSSPLMIIGLVVVAALCVVATFLAWFVVICRDRRKAASYRSSSSGGGAASSRFHSILRVDHVGSGVPPSVSPPPLFSYSRGGAHSEDPFSTGGGDGGSQSSSGKDSGTGDDLPSELDSIPILQSEHESLMRDSWRKPELETFTTFGGCGGGRPVRATLGPRKDVISVTHPLGGEFLTMPRKVGMPLPPPSFIQQQQLKAKQKEKEEEKEKKGRPLTGDALQVMKVKGDLGGVDGGSSSSSSGYSTLGIRSQHGRREKVWVESSGSGTDYMSSTDGLSHTPGTGLTSSSSDCESTQGALTPLPLKAVDAPAQKEGPPGGCEEGAAVTISTAV